MQSTPSERSPLLRRPKRLAGAWAYILTRRGAQRLLAGLSDMVAHPVDLYLATRASRDLESFAFSTPPGFFDPRPPLGGEGVEYFGIVKVDYLPSMIGDRTTG